MMYFAANSCQTIDFVALYESATDCRANCPVKGDKIFTAYDDLQVAVGPHAFGSPFGAFKVVDKNRVEFLRSVMFLNSLTSELLWNNQFGVVVYTSSGSGTSHATKFVDEGMIALRKKSDAEEVAEQSNSRVREYLGITAFERLALCPFSVSGPRLGPELPSGNFSVSAGSQLGLGAFFEPCFCYWKQFLSWHERLFHADSVRCVVDIEDIHLAGDLSILAFLYAITEYKSRCYTSS